MNKIFTRLFLLAIAVLTAHSGMAADVPAKSSPSIITLFLDDLSPAAREKWGANFQRLAPGGHELAEWFLRPLAEGRGPLTAPELSAEAAKAAKDQNKLKALLAHRVSLLAGYPEQDLGAQIDWYRAPKEDWQWPTHLSRHYWAKPLAAAWRSTRDPRYSGEAVAILTDWVRRTPLLTPGLKWGTPRSLEAGVPATSEGPFKTYGDGPWTSLSADTRVKVWTEFFQYLWDAPQMNNENVALLLHSLARDHRLLLLNHERWGTANQYTSVAGGLVHLNWWYPDFAGSARAEAVGWQRLGKVARMQAYPDGSMAECSPNYATGSLLGLLELVENGRRQQHSVPEEIKTAVVRGARYFALIVDPLGRTPRIAKGGGSVRSALLKMNEVAQDPEVAFVASGGREGRTPSQKNLLFPWAGHAVFRSGWDERATWMFFEPGPRGSGHHDLAQLGVQLIANGEWLLTDPGFYSYSSAGEEAKMAEYLHSSAAHNVALVDGQGQITSAPGSARGPNSSAGDYRWSEAANAVSASGVYSYGFGEKGKIAVRHYRTVTWLPNQDEFEIRDRFEGTGRHRLELRWQCDPLAKVTAASMQATVAMSRTSLEINSTSAMPLQYKLIRGEKDPLGGWFSAGYGKLETAPMLSLSGEAELPQQIVTRLKIHRSK